MLQRRALVAALLAPRAAARHVARCVGPHRMTSGAIATGARCRQGIAIAITHISWSLCFSSGMMFLDRTYCPLTKMLYRKVAEEGGRPKHNEDFSVVAHRSRRSTSGGLYGAIGKSSLRPGQPLSRDSSQQCKRGGRLFTICEQHSMRA